MPPTKEGDFKSPLDSPSHWRLQDKGKSKTKQFFFTFEIMTFQLKVPNMACSACVRTIANAITIIDPTAKVEADSKTKLVNIETQQSELAVKQAITAAGYTVAK